MRGDDVRVVARVMEERLSVLVACTGKFIRKGLEGKM